MSQERGDIPAILPDSGEIQPSDAPDDQGLTAPSGDHRSLVDDIEDLVLDAKTYIDAELSYQKTRASFVGASVKRMLAFGVIAAVLVFFAAIGLTVGLIIALTPLITAWGATAVVVGVMVLLALLLVRGAAKAWSDMMAAIKEEEGDAPDGDATQTRPQESDEDA